MLFAKCQMLEAKESCRTCETHANLSILREWYTNMPVLKGGKFQLLVYFPLVCTFLQRPKKSSSSEAIYRPKKYKPKSQNSSSLVSLTSFTAGFFCLRVSLLTGPSYSLSLAIVKKDISSGPHLWITLNPFVLQKRYRQRFLPDLNLSLLLWAKVPSSCVLFWALQSSTSPGRKMARPFHLQNITESPKWKINMC